MKRIKYNDYKRIIGYFGGAIIGIIVAMSGSTDTSCTPSQDTQQLSQQMTDMQTSFEFAITELPLSCK